MKEIYIVTDPSDNDIVVALGTKVEIAKLLNTTLPNVCKCIKKGMRLKHKYEITKLEVEEDERTL